MSVKINSIECLGCGECMCVCPQDVFEHQADIGATMVVRPENCVDCEGCIEVCPVGALTKE